MANVPSLSSSVLVSYFLSFVSLGKVNLLRAELGLGLSRAHFDVLSTSLSTFSSPSDFMASSDFSLKCNFL